MPTRREVLRGLVAGGVVGVDGSGTQPHAVVTADDQRRWAGIVRDWNPEAPGIHDCVLTQINQALFDAFPGEWQQPYRGFVYGFRGIFSAQERLDVCGQWVAMRATTAHTQVYLYASVPGDVVARYAPGDVFYIPSYFPRADLQTPAGFAELWAAVRASQGRILQAIDQIS